MAKQFNGKINLHVRDSVQDWDAFTAQKAPEGAPNVLVVLYDDVDQPYLPEDGYHLSRDLTDQALRFIRDPRQSEPEKPWYLWFRPGANHAPTTLRRSTSPSTAACSTTATRPTGSGSCPG